ncbi:lipid droplet-associated hydrolase [Cydia fagiglandana]|uniref:lipid droplet-associated hydrolase n=1 Tax=Cydia fagiglandana TaxID=1458189 RepID=UPI002FEE1628
MESVFINLNNVQTNVLTWGDPFDSKNSDVIICITGNPGIPHFYEEFATELNKSTSLPICVIGQAGHVEVPEERSNVLERREHLFNLEAQVHHKLDLIDKIDKRRNIHLIGHSIGAWLILEAINKRDSLIDRICSVNLLFPTIQRMADSPNGKKLNGIVRRLHFVAILLFTLIHSLPDAVQRFLVGAYLKLNRLPPHYDERILKYLRPRVAEKVLHMAYDEMDRVVSLERVSGALARTKQITHVVYGAQDGWAPPAYMDDLRRFQPDLQMTRVHIDHTFVLTSSEKVAELVSDYIKPKIKSC